MDPKKQDASIMWIINMELSKIAKDNTGRDAVQQTKKQVLPFENLLRIASFLSGVELVGKISVLDK